MTPGPLASELLKNLPPSDASAQAAQATARDQRRVRRLVWLTFALWFLTVALVPAFFLPMLAMIRQEMQQLAGHTAPTDPALTPQALASALNRLLESLAIVGSALVLIFSIVSLLASVVTIRLVLTVRHVTTRQLQTGLAQISDELKRLGTAQT